MNFTSIGAAVGALLSLAMISWAGGAAAAPPAYHKVAAVALSAPDRWDYVVFDPTSGRVFVAHGDRVDVVEARTGRVVGAVRGIAGGAHGIAVVPAAGRGYTDDGKAGLAVAFDLKTLRAGKSLKADADADAIAFDPASGHVFVVSGDPGVVTVIDPKTDAVVATISVGEKLEYAVSGNDGKLYVNGNGADDLVRVDTAANRVDAHWKLGDCKKPKGLSIDTASHRLFASCANNVLVVVNADSGAVVATLPIGVGTDAVAFDPARKRVFSSNGDGTLTIIEEKDANTFVSLGSIATAATGRTMSLDPRTGRLFIAAGDAAPGPGPRRAITPGSLKLIILDPAPPGGR